MRNEYNFIKGRTSCWLCYITSRIGTITAIAVFLLLMLAKALTCVDKKVTASHVFRIGQKMKNVVNTDLSSDASFVNAQKAFDKHLLSLEQNEKETKQWFRFDIDNIHCN